MWGYLDHGQVIVKQASLLVNLGDLRSGRTICRVDHHSNPSIVH